MDACYKCEKAYEVYTSTVEHPYDYSESGLQGVRLIGVHVYSCPSCGVVSADIPALEGLHELLAKDIILRPVAMNGREFRFLRKEMRKKPKDLAEQFGVDPKTISNWEAAEKLGRQTDLTMRMLAAMELWKGEKLAEVVDAISRLVSYSWEGDPTAEINELAEANTIFDLDNQHRWRMAA
jgi:DNA-binding transcriptional regulator YiaG